MKKILMLSMTLFMAPLVWAVDNLPAVKVNGSLTLQDDSVVDTRLTAIEASTGTLNEDAIEQFTQVAIDTTTIASSVGDKVDKTGDTMTGELKGTSMVLSSYLNASTATFSGNDFRIGVGLRYQEIADSSTLNLTKGWPILFLGPYSMRDTTTSLGIYGNSAPIEIRNNLGQVKATIHSGTGDASFATIAGTGLGLSGPATITSDGNNYFRAVNSTSFNRAEIGLRDSGGEPYLYGLGNSYSFSFYGPGTTYDFIDTGRNLAIGQGGAPIHKFHVNGGILATSSITTQSGLYSAGLEATGGISLKNGSNIDAISMSQVGPGYGSLGINREGGQLVHNLNGNITGTSFVNLGGGNFGIGTNSASHKLTVSGGILATSSITADGGLYGDGANLTGVTKPADLNAYFHLTNSGQVVSAPYPRFRGSMIFDSSIESYSELAFRDGSTFNSSIMSQPSNKALYIHSYSDFNNVYRVESGKHSFVTGDNILETFTVVQSSVGVRNASPNEALDVTGNIHASAKITAAVAFSMGYERISNGGTGTTFTATCSAGKKVTGGGCQTNGAILASYPASDTTFTCTTLASAATTAWAICGRIE